MGLSTCFPSTDASSQAIGEHRPALGVEADFLQTQRYEQALALISAGALSEARKLLIELVEQLPAWPAPWLELALIAIRLGAPEEAEEFLQALEMQFSPIPTEVQQKIDAMRAQLREQVRSHMQALMNNPYWTNASDSARPQPARVKRGIHANAFLGSGFEQNPNLGIKLGAVLLTLPGGDQWFDVAPSNRPDPSAFARLGFRLMASSEYGWGEVRTSLALQAKKFEAGLAADTRELAADFAFDPVRGPFVLTFSAQALRASTRLVYQGLNASLALRPEARLKLGLCSIGSTFSYENREYPSNALFDGDWRALRLDYGCMTSTPSPWLTYLQWGLDQAKAQRPGGDTRQQSLGFLKQWLPLGEKGLYRWQLHAEVSRSEDNAPYSALLAYGAPRVLKREQLAISWTLAPFSLNTAWLTMGARLSNQSSNIGILTMKNFHVESTIWKSW